MKLLAYTLILVPVIASGFAIRWALTLKNRGWRRVSLLIMPLGGVVACAWAVSESRGRNEDLLFQAWCTYLGLGAPFAVVWTILKVRGWLAAGFKDSSDA